MHAARHDTQAALEAADARAQAAREHASGQITQIRREAGDATAAARPSSTAIFRCPFPPAAASSAAPITAAASA